MIESELKIQLEDAKKTIRMLQNELEETNKGLIALSMELEEKVEERTAELKKANEVLNEEIIKRKNVEENIRKLNVELEQRVADRTMQLEASNRELQAFSYSVSHDLRTPLRAIDGFSLALIEDYYDKMDGQAKNYLDRIRNASQRMAQLIDDLLNLSRITRSEIVRENVDMSHIAEQIVSDLRSQEPERSVECIIAENVTAYGDSHLMHIVLDNLLGNAWKYTGKKGDARIEFGTTEIDGGKNAAGNKKIYFVRDNGAGFNMEYSDKLFVLFQRLHSNNEFSGTGVGLATVQRIIHKHSGRIWAEGEMDKGAVFYFTLQE